jgi:ribosomal protein S18 acetylase RimI-like enzyme
MILPAAAIGEVASLHRRALPDDILPALGEEVLRRYYDGMLASGRAALIGARSGGRLAGFILVSFAGPSIAQALRGSLGHLLRRAAAAALRRPMLLLDAAASVAKAGAQPEAESEISYIAVDPREQGRGVGTALVARLDQYLGERGIGTCRTKTLVGNRHVIDLYSKHFARVEVKGEYHAFRRRYMFLLLSREA